MYLFKIILAGIIIKVAATIGFTGEILLIEGADNSKLNSTLDANSDAFFLYIQMTEGNDHSTLVQNFTSLVNTLGASNISVIPRVRYGVLGKDESTAEPSDSSIITKDVAMWADAFSAAASHIPVLQAGFLGKWGEWHDGPFCPSVPTTEQRRFQSQIVQTLLGTNIKVALRYPPDHLALSSNNPNVTLHDDCIFDGGPQGGDGGTFDINGSGNTSQPNWIDYTKRVASGNTFGGESCEDAGDADPKYWTPDQLCGSDGLEVYINTFKISYLKNTWPNDLVKLLNNQDYTTCVARIRAALRQWS